jgi:maltose alpha-D-glucosyltransferase / alpha-amylase
VKGDGKQIMAKRPGSAGDPLWYKDAILYELHVRAFQDGNGDGIGDFPGLIQKLDHQDLDHQDLGVHSMYGTIDDFLLFLAAAQECTLQFPLARSSRKGDACWRYCGS